MATDFGNALQSHHVRHDGIAIRRRSSRWDRAVRAKINRRLGQVDSQSCRQPFRAPKGARNLSCLEVRHPALCRAFFVIVLNAVLLVCSAMVSRRHSPDGGNVDNGFLDQRHLKLDEQLFPLRIQKHQIVLNGTDITIFPSGSRHVYFNCAQTLCSRNAASDILSVGWA
jgi:LSD1 subclass zinc finger protein